MLASLRVDALLLGATHQTFRYRNASSAEVFPVAAGAGADLALVLGADC